MWRNLFLTCSLIGVASPLFAQGGAVQLPTFDIFTVSTTVSVPDRGAISLGGGSRLAEGSTSRGVPIFGKLPGLSRLAKNKGIGREASRRGLSVHATIISLSEMEEELFGTGSSATAATDAFALARAADLARHMTSAPLTLTSSLPSSTSTPALRLGPNTSASVKSIKAARAAAKSQTQQEALAIYQKAVKAQRAGRTGAAKIYFQMAARRGDEAMKKQVAAHLDEIAQQANRPPAKATSP